MDNYKTTEEKSEQWGVTSKTIQNLCRQGKIPGAIKRAGAWFIPNDTPNPLKNTKSNSRPFQFVGTKKKIFDFSIELFMKNGFEHVSIKDIAKLAGIRQSAVYNHFSSKQKLIDTIYDFYLHYFFVNRPSLEDLEPVLRNGSILEIINSIRYDFEDGYVRQKMLEITILIFQRQVSDEHARMLIKHLMIDCGIEFVKAVFNKAIEIGRLAPFDTNVVSVFINSVRIYTLHVTIVDPSPESLEAMMRDEQALYELVAAHMTDLAALR